MNDTNDHRRHIAGALLSLADHCHTALHRHHHRERVTLFRPEVCHRIQRRPIRWDNPTATEHTITHLGCLEDGSACAFDSGVVLPGRSSTLPGLAPGHYPYICRLHPIMHGVLIVIDPPRYPHRHNRSRSLEHPSHRSLRESRPVV